MSENLIIIDYKFIGKWLIIITTYFLLGHAMKNYLGYFTIVIFLFFYTQKLYTHQIYLLFIWFFIYEYFIGVGLLHSSGPDVSSATTFFALFTIFINSKRLGESLNNKHIRSLLYLHFLLFLCLLISFIINNYKPLRLIRFFDYFLIFISILSTNFKLRDYGNMVNLLFAIGIFQIPVTFAQYYRLVPAPTVNPVTNRLGSSLHETGLDDIACGTFGAISSPDLSLFLSLLALILFIYGLKMRKLIYYVMSVFLLLQYTIVDSKTVLFVFIIIAFLTILLTPSYRYYLLKTISFKTIIIVSIIIVGFYFSIINFYEKGYSESRGSELNNVTNVSKKSFQLVTKYFWEWGKIQGFKYVRELQNKEGGNLNTLFGMGIGEYSLEQRQSVSMKTNYNFLINGFFNNFVKGESTLIVLFATIGIIGLILVFLIYIRLYKLFAHNTLNDHFTSSIYLIGRSFIIGCLLYSFLHFAFNLNGKSITLFWIFIAITHKMQTIKS